jgi:hypothetical protein
LNFTEKLTRLYANKSKHSNYQILPTKVAQIIGDNKVETTSRAEKERLDFLVRHLEIEDKTILDIGGNTGYFTFETLDLGAKATELFEGNKEHTEFVELSADTLGLEDKVKVTNEYFKFDGSYIKKFNIILLFNVLHHLGDDYGNSEVSLDKAKSEMINQLNSLSGNCEELVFQMGFNWHGNRDKPLFEGGTKEEMIDFVKKGIAKHWEIKSIGIASKAGDTIEYKEIDDKNIERDDSLGEFLNRPLFILRSLG